MISEDIIQIKKNLNGVLNKWCSIMRKSCIYILEFAKETSYEKNTNKYNGMLYGMCIGVGVGTALGVVFNHTILGLAIGLGVGMLEKETLASI